MNTTTRDKLPEETQKQKEDGDLSYFGTGDTYTVDDDNTEAGIYISADDKAAAVHLPSYDGKSFRYGGSV